MVGPIDQQQRQVSLIVLGTGFTLLIGVSAGGIAIQADASVTETLLVVGVGIIVGALLTWYLVYIIRKGATAP